MEIFTDTEDAKRLTRPRGDVVGDLRSGGDDRLVDVEAFALAGTVAEPAASTFRNQSARVP